MREISALKQQKKSHRDKQTYLNIKYLHPAEGRKKKKPPKKQQSRKIYFLNVTIGK